MVKVRGFEFSLTEFAGALGDFGPLNPFILGYVAILGLNPAGIFLAMGLTNIVLGLTYRLPLPVEAKKAIGTVALNERWNPSQVYISGLLTGVVWLLLSSSRLIKKLAELTPIVVTRGIQLGLMLILLRGSLIFMTSDPHLAIISIAIIVLLIKNRFLPSAIAVFSLGLAIVFLSNPHLNVKVGFYLPPIIVPSIQDITLSLLTIVFAQIVLTFSNAVLATCLAVNERFPNQKIKEASLAMNMGLMNTFFPFIGGIPLCHGAGGFASQYFFGARTGGAMIMEGICEIILALFLADSITAVFASFPSSIIGAMLLFTSLELGKFVVKVGKMDFIIILTIGVISFLVNLAVGFLLGLALYYVVKRTKLYKDHAKSL